MDRQTNTVKNITFLSEVINCGSYGLSDHDDPSAYPPPPPHLKKSGSEYNTVTRVIG